VVAVVKLDPKSLGPLSESRFIYIAIAFFFVFYFITKSWLFGLLIGLSIAWLVILECWQGVKEHGVKNEVKEIAIALIAALVIYYGAGFLLNTPSPINAIVSCSMLPHISRGDMVLLSGSGIQAPTAEVDTLNGIEMATVIRNGTAIASVNGSLYSHCAQTQDAPLCRGFVENPSLYSERKGPLLIGYGQCERITDAKQRLSEPCVEWLEVGGARYYENLSNDVVVYQPERDEYYARVGDIIHRAYIKLANKQDGKTYVLTKGDNNPIFDIQVFDDSTGSHNRPIEASRIKGKIIFKVPILGYFKLFISPSAIATPPGCDYHYSKYGI
jgi:signal peptidase I